MKFKQLINILLIIASISLTLGVFEAWVRYSGLWKKVSYADRNYFVKSTLKGVPYILKAGRHARWADTDIYTNAEGIREKKDYLDKKSGVFRILAVGDSFTFGMGVDQYQTYPKQLEQLLNSYDKANIKYEVLNAGISGYNAVDTANFLSRLATVYNPDLILWLLVINDYDDSLSVNQEGRMVHGNADYAATQAWLQSTWGLKGNTINLENFLLSMDEERKCWAWGVPYVKQPNFKSEIDAFLLRYSFAYCYVKQRLSTIGISPENSISAGPDVHLLQRPYTSDTYQDFLPWLSSIFVSPFYRERFEGALQKGVETAKQRNIPILIMGFDLYLDDLNLGDYKGAGTVDIAAYLDRPLMQFYLKYNLGWDGHLNPEGNRLLAKAVLNVLQEKQLIRLGNFEPITPYDKSAFWKAYVKERDAYIANLKPFIDFKHFRNIDQLVGGLYPPRVFPIKGNAKLSLVMAPPKNSRFVLRGDNTGVDQELNLWLSDGRKHFEKRIIIKKGVFDIEIDIPENLISVSLLDVQLQCASDVCLGIRLDYIGRERMP